MAGNTAQTDATPPPPAPEQRPAGDYADVRGFLYGALEALTVGSIGLIAEPTPEEKADLGHEHWRSGGRVLFGFIGAVATGGTSLIPVAKNAGGGALVIVGVEVPSLAAVATGSVAGVGILDWAMSEGSGDSGKENKSDVRNPSQEKVLSKGDIKKLEKAGFDVHELKGGKHTGKIDLFKGQSGNVYIKPTGGRGPGELMYINLNNL